MGFKMKGINFGKGTKGLPKKTHLKKDEYVPQSVDVNRGKELDVDPNDPDYFNMMHTDKDYISMDMRAGEEGERGPGEDIERSSGYGSSRNTSEKHENYRGVKDAGAGYDDFTLGQQNEQEKLDEQRFYTDLNKNLKNYKSELPISGDWKMDDETFDYWKKVTNAQGNPYELKQRFEKDVTNSLNLDNELKLATEAGYKPDSIALESADPNISLEEGDYKLNQGKYDAHRENYKLRQTSMANRKADDAMNDANEYVDKYGGSIADYFNARPNKRDDVQGIHSFGQVDVATQGFYDDALYDNMSKKEKKQHDKKKEEERQEKLQIKSEIEANLPDDGKSDSSLMVDSGKEGDDTEDSNINTNAFVDDNIVEGREEETGGKEKFDPMDTNQDGYVDKWEKKDYAKLQEQDQEDATVVEKDVTASNNEKGDGGYVPQSQRGLTKKPVFGTDEYYDFMKKKRTEEMGLTKRMFNIYDKD